MRRLGFTAAVLIVAWLACASAAVAHPTLLFTEPAADSAVGESPRQITLLFNEAVVPHAMTVLKDGRGRELPMGAPTTARGAMFVSAAPAGPLSPGTYVLRWRVTGSDGDLVENEFRFTVGVALTAGGGENALPGGASTAWSDAAWRWLLFAGLAIGFGGLFARRLVVSARAERPDLPPPRSLVKTGLVLALGGVAGLAVSAVADADAISVLWTGAAGRVLLVEAVALVVAFVAVALGRHGLAVIALLPVFAAEGLRAHPNAAVPGWGAVTTAIHLAAVALWIGVLAQTVVVMIAWRRRDAAVRWVLAGYIRMAAWTVAVVLGTGAVSALLVIPLSALLSTRYGLVLVVKLALVVGAASLALAARRSRPLQRDPARAQAFMRAEIAVLTIVLVASAALVSTPPGTAAPQAPPPAPIGPVLALGTLAGQVGVGVAASEGLLVVRLSTPRRGDYYAPETEQSYTLSGSLGDSGRLTFRGCGQGCFTAPTQWRASENVLTLRVAAGGWHGGTVALLVPWPTEPGDQDLAHAAAALRATPQVTVYETVTSDTTTAPPEPTRLELTGAFLLGQESYAAGAAPLARRISAPGRPLRLALGFPAASINVALTLDDRGRIAEETLTDAKHLVTRRFLYPDHD